MQQPKIQNTKIQFSPDQRYVQLDDIFDSIFYKPNMKRHKEIARKFVDSIKQSDGELNTSKKVWRTLCEGLSLNPDSTKDTSLFYFSIRKIIKAGLVEKKGFTYRLTYKFCERLQELSNLWLSYKNRIEEVEE